MQEMKENNITNRFVRHYKGKIYLVVGVALSLWSASTHQENNDKIVILRGMDGVLLYRPLNEFLDPYVPYPIEVYSIGGADHAMPQERGPRYRFVTS